MHIEEYLYPSHAPPLKYSMTDQRNKIIVGNLNKWTEYITWNA
jgi:hypothetical protein